jgi:hypothetical protein
MSLRRSAAGGWAACRGAGGQLLLHGQLRCQPTRQLIPKNMRVSCAVALTQRSCCPGRRSPAGLPAEAAPARGAWPFWTCTEGRSKATGLPAIGCRRPAARPAVPRLIPPATTKYVAVSHAKPANLAGPPLVRALPCHHAVKPAAKPRGSERGCRCSNEGVKTEARHHER